MAPFWVVWSPRTGDTGPSKAIYATLAEAEAEADRLSKLDLKPVYVLQFVSVFRTTVADVVTTVERPTP